MPQAVTEMLQNGRSYDEPDRMPSNVSVSYLEIIMYIVAIVGHFIDLGIDMNVAIRYYLSKMMMEFGWTLAFILLPAFVNTAVSIRMYSQDKQQASLTNEVTKRKWLRIFILVLQMAPILRFTDALIYAIKSRQAEKKKDPSSQRMYYALMLKEDSDAALLRIFECFLEAAPQHVLQASLLFHERDHLEGHQILSICSSVVGMGWCLAAYQRAIRFAQQDKNNVTWTGTTLQTIWHFLVTFSRVTSISLIAYLYPNWTILACSIHILVMVAWLQIFGRSPFCANNRIGDIAFSFALGAVYLFTYVLPMEGRTRYRYTIYYVVCFIQNTICAFLWYTSDEVSSKYFYPVLILSTLPFLIGICFMLIYYGFFHPKVGKSSSEPHVSFKADTHTMEIS